MASIHQLGINLASHDIGIKFRVLVILGVVWTLMNLVFHWHPTGREQPGDTLSSILISLSCCGTLSQTDQGRSYYRQTLNKDVYGLWIGWSPLFWRWNMIKDRRIGETKTKIGDNYKGLQMQTDYIWHPTVYIRIMKPCHGRTNKTRIYIVISWCDSLFSQQ